MSELTTQVRKALGEQPAIMTDGGCNCGSTASVSTMAAQGQRGEVIPQAETLVIEDTVFPRAVEPGDVFNIRTTFGCRTNPPGTDCEAFARVRGGSIDERQPSSGSIEIGDSGSHTYEFPNLPAPSQPGRLTLTIEAVEIGPFGGTNVEDSQEIRIEVETGQEQITNALIRAAPWVASGTALGGGFGALSEAPPDPVAGAALGGGVSSTAFLLQDEVVIPDISFPTVPVLATAGLLGAGAIFLSASGIGDVTQELAETATGGR